MELVGSDDVIGIALPRVDDDVVADEGRDETAQQRSVAEQHVFVVHVHLVALAHN